MQESKQSDLNCAKIIADLRAEIEQLQMENFAQSTLIHELRLENKELEAACEDMEEELNHYAASNYFRDWEDDDE